MKYSEMEVWKEGIKLVDLIYQVTDSFPKGELFGLVSQMRRSAVSIPSNVAEGCGRNHPRDSRQFFFVARGSLYELETQIIIAKNRGFLSESHFNECTTLVQKSRMLICGIINRYERLMA